MSNSLSSCWDLIENYLQTAKGIAWDTCHKIYILMDDEQVAEMRANGYGDDQDPDSLITDQTPEQMFDTLQGWWDESCDLRFIDAVASVPEGADPNEGFTTLINQFYYDEN